MTCGKLLLLTCIISSIHYFDSGHGWLQFVIVSNQHLVAQKAVAIRIMQVKTTTVMHPNYPRDTFPVCHDRGTDCLPTAILIFVLHKKMVVGS